MEAFFFLNSQMRTEGSVGNTGKQGSFKNNVLTLLGGRGPPRYKCTQNPPLLCFVHGNAHFIWYLSSEFFKLQKNERVGLNGHWISF